MNSKDRRKHGKEFAYLFFFLEIIVIVEIAYAYTLLFGTNQFSLIILAVLTLYFLNNALQRLNRVLNRIAFKEYHFHSHTKDLHYSL
ncbi:MAG: hypothetical protein ABGW85_05910 [Sulfurimonas sp.]